MKYALSKEARIEIDLGIYDYPIHPFRKHPTDAGIDLHAMGDYLISPHSSKVLRTGISFEIPSGCMGLIKPKSKNNHLVGAGIVDQNFRGEILVKVFNPTKNAIVIKHGDGIAQLVIVPILTPELEWADEINSDTDRGNSGGIVTQLNNEGNEDENN